VIELHDDDPDALEHILQYLYTPDHRRCTQHFCGFSDIETTVIHHAKVAIVADKYGITSLRDKAFRAILFHRGSMSVSWVANLTTRIVADIGPQKALDDFVLCMTEDHFTGCYRFEAFRECLTKVPQARDTLCEEHIVELMDIPEFRTELAASGERAVLYLQYFVDHHKRSTSELRAALDAKDKELKAYGGPGLRRM